MTKATATNPKDVYGVKKVPALSVVPPASLIYEGLAMEDGARKYGPYNWRDKDVKASIYVDACVRHLMAWYDGEANATDSGKPHLAHAKACLGILADAIEGGFLVDDRPKPGPGPELLDLWDRSKSPEINRMPLPPAPSLPQADGDQT